MKWENCHFNFDHLGDNYFRGGCHIGSNVMEALEPSDIAEIIESLLGYVQREDGDIDGIQIFFDLRNRHDAVICINHEDYWDMHLDPSIRQIQI